MQILKELAPVFDITGMNIDNLMLSELNLQQQKAVTTTNGPVLVLAGAGSGKTRVVVYRAAYLIYEKYINPNNILIVTFTNRAARELRNRIWKKSRIPFYGGWTGTFHSICMKILRFENEHLPYTSNFSIYDDVDQKSIFKKIYKKLNIDSKVFSPAKVRSIISRQKSNLILPDEFEKFNENNYYTDLVLKIYREYQRVLSVNNAMDFDDLLMYTARLFDENKKVREKYSRIFKYIMIDEYQDTNYAQFNIINSIAKQHQNLCVVGDDDQAIYSWRGANIQNILNFEKDYKNVVTIKLEQNYRSPENILALANSLIVNNNDRHSKELWTEITSDVLPLLIKSENENSEAKMVAEDIAKFKFENLNECVVLYRTNAQSRVFENAFIQKNIKYQIIGGVNFFQRKEIKDIIAYLRVLINPIDNESLLRIINFPPRGIGKVTLNKLFDAAVENNRTLFNELNSEKKDYLSGSAQNKLKQFCDKIEDWNEYAQEKNIVKVVKKIIKELHLIDLYDFSADPKDISRVENIKEFAASVEEFYQNFLDATETEPMLTDYIQNISLQTDMDNVDENEESVKLMTMHNAKGLEFDHVFIVGLEDGLLPHSRSMESLQDLEEERRLLYVAITRAKRSVTMSYANSRRFFEGRISTLPSRFILELDKKYYIDRNNFFEQEVPKAKKPVNTSSIILESEKHFKVGQKIAHNKFGKGVILSVNGKGKDAKLTISFSGGMLKKIIGTFVETL